MLNMDRITFTVNGNKYSVGSEVDSDVSINVYLRNFLNLRGTKYMCKEGGCGCCIVAARIPYEHGKRTLAVNSCLVSITSCQDWDIITVEGLGDRRTGYHPVQRVLADNNGTQCGYCSPGWVMNMYSLLESKAYELSQDEIENSFGGNICRCTGYRPILDAFKTFAKDGPRPQLVDIEELKSCKGTCKKDCDKDWCVIEKLTLDDRLKKIKLKDDRMWYRVKELKDIFRIFDAEGTASYMLINGNTGRGAFHIFAFPQLLIDVSPIEALRTVYIDQNLVVGAGTTLTDFMQICQKMAKEREEFSYLEKFYEHLDLVAHIPVRNVGSIAGNLMVKHRVQTFSSDVFLLLESVGAMLIIVSKTETIKVTPVEFLSLDMTGRVITEIKLPPLTPTMYKYLSFKVLPRSQNAYAQVNAAFLYKFDLHDKDVVSFARIVIGGLSAEFVHAKQTEQYLIKKKIFTNEVLQESLKILEKELIVTEIAGSLSPEYRKKCALGLYYKALLVLIPQTKLKPMYRSGARDFRKTRPLSKGTEVYDTNPLIWPLTEPMPKVEALIQCAGEAFYVNDLPTQPKETFCAFVTADIGVGEIESIDPIPALKLPGVLAFFSAKDIPGRNSFITQRVFGQPFPEEVFADNKIQYYDQAIGLIVAETEEIANRAALIVHVKYKKDDKKPILTIKEAKERDPSRITLYLAVPERERGADVQSVLKGSDDIFAQYHYSMETLSCVTVPSDVGLEVYASTQWLDSTQSAISEALDIPQNRINVTTPRCGGAYGNKISRSTHIAVACSLATYLLNRPCRFVISIQGNLRVIGKRLPCTRDFELGVNSEGEIQYMVYNLYEDNGYIFNELIITLSVSGVKNAYNSRRWQINYFNATTNTASNTYCRSPGSFEAIAMTEMVMERIAYELNLDPYNVRIRNLDTESADLLEIAQKLIKDSDYYERRKEVEKYNKVNRWTKRGLRIAFMSWPMPLINDNNVLLSVFHGDATVIVQHGGVELGQGINTKVIQAIAYTLNISMHKIKVLPNNTSSNPNTTTTGGSRTTQAVIFGALKCCQILLDRLSAVREELKNPSFELLITTAHNRGINLQTSYKVTTNDQAVYRSSGAAIAEVELDILTGQHDVLRVDLIEDVGTSLNPELDIGQIEGAFIMGLGYWTHEHLIYHETGELLTDRTWNYHVPVTKDIPIDFRVQLRRNSYNPVGTLGARAVAEPATTMAICVAFALREAIASSREDSGCPKNQYFEVGHCGVNKHMFNLKLRESRECRLCKSADETPVHLICECGPLIHIRYRHLGRHLLQPEDVFFLTAKDILRLLTAAGISGEL